MKALIRHNGETVLEPFEGIDWTTGAPLTNPAWAGGAYALCEDCPVPDPEPADFDITIIEAPDLGTATVPTVVRRIATFSMERYIARKQQEATE